jgi:hypothetical protein
MRSLKQARYLAKAIAIKVEKAKIWESANIDGLQIVPAKPKIL